VDKQAWSALQSVHAMLQKEFGIKDKLILKEVAAGDVEGKGGAAPSA
jgi:hypothetical protein